MKASGWILAFFYFLSVTGYGLKLHYCLGRVTDVNYALLDTSCQCDGTHADFGRDCCEEREFFVQLDEDHHVSGKPEVVPIVHYLADVLGVYRFECRASDTEIQLSDRAPPLPEDFQAMYCTFQLYG